MDKKPIKKSQLSLSTCILIGLLLGILCGVFFGEYCAPLEVFGDAFIKLLQMTVLPYITVALVASIGSLTYSQARGLGIKGGLLLLLFWGMGFVVILLMPLSFPALESASFFSTSFVETKEKVDMLDLYIPSNPFRSLANNLIPAVVLFCIVTGVALISVREKESLLESLSSLASALKQVARFIVYLTPIGVFAISASAAGTIRMEEFERLQVYLVTFIIAVVLLTFWILPMLLTTVTPFRYKDMLGISKDALITGFTTGSLFIILPILIQNAQDLLRKYELEQEESDSLVDIIIPVFFSFPHLGKLLTLLFVLFAAWFLGDPLSIMDYPAFISSGLVSMFAGSAIALPFMLDVFRIPIDVFQLFIITGVINGRFATLLAAMSLMIFTLAATCALTGHWSLNWKKLINFSLITTLLIIGVISGARVFLSWTTGQPYTKDKVVAGMHLLNDPVPAVVHKTAPPAIEVSSTGRSRLERIRERGVLRVGYSDWLPWAFFNSAGDLVGFDIDMAHTLARELGVTLEFIPLDLETAAQQLNDNHFDIIMMAQPVTTDRLGEVEYSEAYLDVTWALAVLDHRRKDFENAERIKSAEELRIAVTGHDPYFVKKLNEMLPQAEVVEINTPHEFFENEIFDVDALLCSAEGGSAWTLLYPGYSIVVPKPGVIKQPVAYSTAKGDQEMVNFMNRWIDLKRKDGTIERIYNYWILGYGATDKEPRWSIIRDVFHWVD